MLGCRNNFIKLCAAHRYTPISDTEAKVANICHEKTYDGELSEADSTITQTEGREPGVFSEVVIFAMRP